MSGIQVIASKRKAGFWEEVRNNIVSHSQCSKLEKNKMACSLAKKEKDLSTDNMIIYVET